MSRMPISERCADAAALLAGLPAGESDAAMAAHVSACPTCAAALGALRDDLAEDDAFGAMLAGRAQARVVAARTLAPLRPVVARAPLATPAGSTAAGRAPWDFPWRAMAGVAAVLALMLGGAVVFVQLGGRDGGGSGAQVASRQSEATDSANQAAQRGAATATAPTAASPRPSPLTAAGAAPSSSAAPSPAATPGATTVPSATPAPSAAPQPSAAATPAPSAAVARAATATPPPAPSAAGAGAAAQPAATPGPPPAATPPPPASAPPAVAQAPPPSAPTAAAPSGGAAEVSPVPTPVATPRASPTPAPTAVPRPAATTLPTPPPSPPPSPPPTPAPTPVATPMATPAPPQPMTAAAPAQPTQSSPAGSPAGTGLMTPAVRVVAAPARVTPGDTVSITAQGPGGAACSIDAGPLALGAGTALSPRAADAAGRVTWTWTLGMVSNGVYRVTVTCGGGSASTTIEVWR